jgi:DNA-binding IclR family transcriptional regulator
MSEKEPAAAGVRSRYRAPAAECAARVLLQLMEHGDALSLADLSRRLDMSKSLVFRVLRELEMREFIEEVEDGRYWLGIQALSIGSTFSAETAHSEITAPILSSLSAEIQAEAWLGVLHGTQMVALMGFGGDDVVVRATYVGARLPAHCTSMGKALLATYSNAEVRRLLGRQLAGLTSRSIVDIERLIDDLEATRARGYAIQEEEAVMGSSGLATVVPLRLPNETRASISVSMPTDHFHAVVGPTLDALLRARREFEEAFEEASFDQVEPAAAERS